MPNADGSATPDEMRQQMASFFAQQQQSVLPGTGVSSLSPDRPNAGAPFSKEDLAQYGIGAVENPTIARANEVQAEKSRYEEPGTLSEWMGLERPPLKHDALPPFNMDAYVASHPSEASQAQQPQIPGMTTPGAPVANGPALQMQQPFAQPARFIPAHHDKSLIPFSEATREDELAGIGRHLGAGQELTDALVKQQDAIAQFHAQQAENADRRAAAQYEAEQARQADYKRSMSQYDRAVSDASSGTINPNRYVESQGWGTRLAGALAVALGGFASLQKGQGNNPVLDMMQKNIDRDIQSQEQSLASKKWKAGAKLNMLGELRAAGMDERAASNTLESMQWKIAEQQLQSQMAQTEDPVLRARGSELSATIQDKLTDLRKQMELMSFVRPQVVGGGAPSKVDLSAVVKDPISGNLLKARNEKVAADLTQLSAELPKIQRYFNEALAIRQKPMWWVNPQDRQRLRSLQTLTAPLISKMGDNSVLRDSEREAMNESVTAFSSWTPGTSENLTKARDGFVQNVEDAFKAQAAPVVETGYRYDANGNLVPAGAYVGKNMNPKASMMPTGAKKIGP